MGVKGCYVEILNPEISTILVETSSSCNNIIEVINTDIILPSSFPDVDANKIIGLKQYLIDNLSVGKFGNFLKLVTIQNGTQLYFGDDLFNLDDYLDYYEFDGGTP
jgi:hypothetical protein